MRKEIAGSRHLKECEAGDLIELRQILNSVRQHFKFCEKKVAEVERKAAPFG